MVDFGKLNEERRRESAFHATWRDVARSLRDEGLHELAIVAAIADEPDFIAGINEKTRSEIDRSKARSAPILIAAAKQVRIQQLRAEVSQVEHEVRTEELYGDAACF